MVLAYFIGADDTCKYVNIRFSDLPSPEEVSVRAITKEGHFVEVILIDVGSKRFNWMALMLSNRTIATDCDVYLFLRNKEDTKYLNLPNGYEENPTPLMMTNVLE